MVKNKRNSVWWILFEMVWCIRLHWPTNWIMCLHLKKIILSSRTSTYRPENLFVAREGQLKSGYMSTTWKIVQRKNNNGAFWTRDAFTFPVCMKWFVHNPVTVFSSRFRTAIPGYSDLGRAKRTAIPGYLQFTYHRLPHAKKKSLLRRCNQRSSSFVPLDANKNHQQRGKKLLIAG